MTDTAHGLGAGGPAAGSPGAGAEDEAVQARGKLKLAFFWAAACGGCDVAVLDIHEKILDVAALADIYLWPVAMDFKYKDVEALPDRFLDVAFYNGAVRNSEQEHMAHLLRRKAKTLVAFGSCACFGGIPSLANLFDREEILDWVYGGTFSTENPAGVRPQPRFTAPEGELTLPEFYAGAYRLQDFVPVDYFLPGCPPTPEWILKAVEAIASGNLPPRGAVLALDKTVCDTCPREKTDKKVKEFHRHYEIIPDPERCLLEQGLICMGPATRGGCGALCPSANMPCRGCYGPTREVVDQGAKMLSAVASILDSDDEEEIRLALARIEDPAGTFWRFGMAASLLGGRAFDAGSAPPDRAASATPPAGAGATPPTRAGADVAARGGKK
ncbi:MAG: oxidoreductase [Bacillota bacterium]|nr:oxidoreductase [Bacillota bacterium]